MSEETKQRAKTVWSKVAERHGAQIEGLPEQSYEPTKLDLYKGAFDRELQRFSALLGVYIAHLATAPLSFFFSVAVFTFFAVISESLGLKEFSIPQVLLLSFGATVVLPKLAFMYKYFLGRF